MNQTLDELRLQIDEADRRLIQAFTDRMEISAGISQYKEAHNMKVYDPVREQKKLCQVELLVEENMRGYVDSLYLLLFELSRNYQNQLQGREAAHPCEAAAM